MLLYKLDPSYIFEYDFRMHHINLILHKHFEMCGRHEVDWKKHKVPRHF